MKPRAKADLRTIAWEAMKKWDFRPQFPQTVKQEMAEIPDGLPKNLPKDTRDLRGLLWSSIDNFDSEDLDQIEYCEKGEKGEIHVKVAIADVDIFVPKNSKTDQHAVHNGTSVYLGVITFPMLPDKLSKGISSLLPGQDRLAMVMEYTVFPNGDTKPGEIYRAIVHNKAKLVYEQVGDWLEGKGPIPETIENTPGLREQVMLQSKAAQAMNAFRTERGALDLDTLEANAVVKDEKVLDIVVQQKNMARSLIEEFMVAGNGTMVAFLTRAKMPMIQRVVRVPKYWDEIMLLATTYGEELPRVPDAKALSVFLTKQKVKDPERFPDLSLTVVKLLGPGEYMCLLPGEPPTGHFSLAVTDYTHSTAPNRRYPDIVNQRILKAALDKRECPYTADDLVDLASWLTDREMASKKVERFMRKAAAAELLADRIGEAFDGLITGASDKGTYVRLLSPPAEGRIIRKEKGLRVGMKVRVRLLSTDPFNGFIDFEYVGTVRK
jgi:exoribonuclease-2